MKKFIFIISAGRSGSTLLQAILNAHDNVLIRGENNNFFYYTMLAHQSLLRSNGRQTPKPGPSSPWYGFSNYDEKSFCSEIRSLGIKYMLGEYEMDQVEYLGFKEIRYFDFLESQAYGNKIPLLTDSKLHGRRKLFSLILFLNKVFNPATFVVLERSSEEICNSAWWNNPDKYTKSILMEDIENFYDVTKEILTNQSLDFHSINYESLRKRNHNSIENLFKAIGIKYDKYLSKKVLNTRLNHCE